MHVGEGGNETGILGKHTSREKESTITGQAQKPKMENLGFDPSTRHRLAIPKKSPRCARRIGWSGHVDPNFLVYPVAHSMRGRSVGHVNFDPRLLLQKHRHLIHFSMYARLGRLRSRGQRGRCLHNLLAVPACTPREAGVVLTTRRLGHLLTQERKAAATELRVSQSDQLDTRGS